MTLFDYYLQYMTELWEGKRPAPGRNSSGSRSSLVVI